MSFVRRLPAQGIAPLLVKIAESTGRNWRLRPSWRSTNQNKLLDPKPFLRCDPAPLCTIRSATERCGWLHCSREFRQTHAGSPIGELCRRSPIRRNHNVNCWRGVHVRPDRTQRCRAPFSFASDLSRRSASSNLIYPFGSRSSMRRCNSSRNPSSLRRSRATRKLMSFRCSSGPPDSNALPRAGVLAVPYPETNAPAPQRFQCNANGERTRSSTACPRHPRDWSRSRN